MRFRLKLALSMLCLMSLLFGVGGSLLISASFADSLARERQTAYGSYQSVLGILQLMCSVQQPSDYDSIAEVLIQFPVQSESWAALRLDSEDDAIYLDGIFPSAELPHTPGTCSIIHLGADSVHYLAVSGTLDASGKTLYLDILYDVTSVFETWEAQLRAYSWVFVFLVALCAFLSYGLSYALTRPLTKLSEASRDIAAGKLSHRAEIHTADEIGRVARDFNAMADTLEQNITELEASVERQKRFTGSFAHEVKTPMTSIIGYADLIRGETLDGEEQRQAANFIFTEGRRLERLSQKLLQLQMLQNAEAELSATQPAALLEALAAQWAPVYEEQGVSLFHRGEDGTCLLEPELVKTLLINLWDNARKAGAKRITVRSSMLPDGCRLTVQDDGQGIPPEALSHLTEAFYRVDKSRSRALGGAGLGLSLCQEIAALHGGAIRFESEPEHGTTVTVDLRGGRV